MARFGSTAPSAILKRKTAVKSTAAPRAGYGRLIRAISAIDTEMVGRVATVANQALVLRNWLVGAYIVEFEQHGADRAKYGSRLLERLAADLKDKGVRGLGDPRVLRDCRVLFQTYPQIRGSVTREFPALPEQPAEQPEKRGASTRESATPLEATQILQLSWTKLQELIRIDNPLKRAFYENECLRGNWSVRQLQRQIGSLLFERTGLSTDRQAVAERARKQERQEPLADILRDPYILEFAGLAERHEYSENDMEGALLDHLQRFLLELGRGFCFEARQFRMTEGRKHHRVDLVFYHRRLRCHVLIDLKVRPFQPGDAGQMNFYVNWFKANMMESGDNPPVGMLLCSDHDGAEVEFATAGMDRQLFVSRYLTALPSVEQMRAFLERDRAAIQSLASR